MSNITKNEVLSKYSWFNLGGPADFLFRPKNINELGFFLKNFKNSDIHVLGAGSNTLIRAGGIKGTVIKLSSSFSYLEKTNENTITVGAATLDRTVSNFSTEHSISGMEFLSCIPGSIGGGIRMNSGCYGEDFSNIFLSLEAMDFKGNIKKFTKKDISFFYRGCDLPEELIILNVSLRGKTASKGSIEKKQLNLIEKKKSSQPSQIKTCGSTFKNPHNRKAWELIKNSNCENLFVGEASISKKHCNFFVNNGKATSLEIEELIKNVRDEVLKQTGVKLELEIKIVGYNN